MPPFTETCQACGATLDLPEEKDAWLCLDCQEVEDPRNTAARHHSHHIPCGQCGACAANEPCARLS